MTYTAAVPRSPKYDARSYPPVAVTADVVVLTVSADDGLQVLLVERGEPPFEGRLALPGGFVRPDEDLEEAARRELAEETGMTTAPHLEQLRTYGAPDRDPRMRVVTVAFLALVPHVGTVVGGTDARGAALHPVATALGRRGRARLAFDHAAIVADAVDRAGTLIERTPVATTFLPREFTIPDLRAVYEAIWGVELDPGNFRRKVLASAGMVVSTDRVVSGTGGRPAELYRRGRARTIDPPLRRPARR